MNFLAAIGFNGFGAKDTAVELPVIFPFPTLQGDFIRMDIETIYSRILTDVLERTQGIPEKYKPLLWDNCLASEKSDGLVSMLVKAMYDKSELFMVFDSATNVVRRANSKEQTEITAGYKAKGSSPVGVYLTFKNYKRTDMLKIYAALEYCAISGLHTSMNLSTALQFKMNDMRASVATSDSSITGEQAKAIAEALKAGRGALLDGKDSIEMAKPDLTATKAAMDFIGEKKSFYLELPASYITGTLPGGLGDSGTGDAKAVERGLRGYYFSLIKPAIEALFGISTEFESEDYAQISSANETLKTFELTSDEYLPAEAKQLIINRMYGRPENAKGGPKPKVVEPRDVTPPAAPQA